MNSTERNEKCCNEYCGYLQECFEIKAGLRREPTKIGKHDPEMENTKAFANMLFGLFQGLETTHTEVSK